MEEHIEEKEGYRKHLQTYSCDNSEVKKSIVESSGNYKMLIENLERKSTDQCSFIEDLLSQIKGYEKQLEYHSSGRKQDVSCFDDRINDSDRRIK